MMTLLMVLFIVLFAISQVDQRKFAALKTGLTSGFGATENVPVTGGTGITQNDGVVPAAFGLDVGLGIKQNTTTDDNNRAYQTGNGTSTTSGGGCGRSRSGDRAPRRRGPSCRSSGPSSGRSRSRWPAPGCRTRSGSGSPTAG